MSAAPAQRPAMNVDARTVVANPEQYAHLPLLRRLAWATLMSGRGLRMDQTRMAQMPVEVSND